LLQDLTHPNTYGKPLIGWKNVIEFYRDRLAPPYPPLINKLAETFVEHVYFLLRTTRRVTVYRGYETPGLRAPYGKDHPTYWHGLIADRQPATPDGRWWSPSRPSLVIDDLKLSSMHRSDVRDGLAISREFGRLDYWLEADLPLNAPIYVGRAGPLQESKLYGGQRLGRTMQFRLTQPPEQAFSWMKRYASR
jgi:hypothetical protein